MIKIEGIEEAIVTMKQLNEATSRKMLMRAMRQAASPLVRNMRKMAPVAERNVREFWGKKLTIPPGTLKRSIRSVIPKSKSDRMVELYVGPTKAKPGQRSSAAKQGKTNNIDGWFRHFVIRGTAGKVIKSGANKGRYIPGQAANPFVDKAVQASKSQVSRNLETSIIKQINKVVNK